MYTNTTGLLRKDFLGAMIAGSLMIPGAALAQVVSENEVNAALNSTAAILNKRQCLTLAEKSLMQEELKRILRRLELERIAVIGRGGLEVIYERPSTERLNYYEKRAKDRIAEIEQYPVCTTDPGSRVGWFVGGYFVKSWQDLKSAEELAATGRLTNQFSDRKDPLGVGGIVGAKFTPWANNIVVSPFVSFEILNMSVKHTFPNGSFLGTTSNVATTAGVKVGPTLDMGLWLYGIAGVSVLNETLKVNFIPIASSRNTTVPGATLGVGGAFQPSFLQGLGRPVSLFLEYQHTWWQDANFNTPTASPAFNYNFRRQDDVIKLGFTVALDAQPPAPAPSYPVKALPLK